MLQRCWMITTTLLFLLCYDTVMNQLMVTANSPEKQPAVASTTTEFELSPEQEAT